MATFTFVFDSSPPMASCQFAAGERAVAGIALPGAHVQVPPAVNQEVVTWGEARPDTLEAAELINVGHILLTGATAVGKTSEAVWHYQLGGARPKRSP